MPIGMSNERERGNPERSELWTPCGGGHMAFLHKPGNGFRPAFHMEFIEDIRQVVFYCLIAQAEMDGDLFVGFPFGQQRQNETFLRGQASDALGSRSQV